jgi:hypothetical protein
VQLWVAREGQPAELVIDWGPYNLTAGAPEEMQRFGKVWLLPYNTGKDDSVAHPTAYTWYDELVISRSRIADPGAPAPPGGDESGGGESGSDGGGSSDGADGSTSGDETSAGSSGGDASGADDGGPAGETSGGADEPTDDDANGCGCRSSAGGSAWLLACVIGFAWRRRRA